MILLPDKYNLALLGHEPATLRAVYSLPMLAFIEAKRIRHTLDVAQAIMVDMAQQFKADHGNEAPIFVDDTLARGGMYEEKSMLILPDVPHHQKS